MTFTNSVVTKDLFEALIRAKRGVRPPSVNPSPMPAVDAAPPYADLLEGDGAVQTPAHVGL